MYMGYIDTKIYVAATKKLISHFKTVKISCEYVYIIILIQMIYFSMIFKANL